jgi:hypothetical protein
VGGGPQISILMVASASAGQQQLANCVVGAFAVDRGCRDF